jgi:hypothetical protein
MAERMTIAERRNIIWHEAYDAYLRLTVCDMVEALQRSCQRHAP